jgi:hypothetical protein
MTAIEDSGEEGEHLEFVRDETFRHALQNHLLHFTLLTTNYIRYAKPCRDFQNDIKQGTLEKRNCLPVNIMPFIHQLT